MGYDLHITRKEFWADEDGPIITPEEWLALVHEDSELSLFPENGEFFALWDGPSRYPDPWLDCFEGEIHTKNPDEPLIAKMLQIANYLGATVQGDKGEHYPNATPPSSKPPSTEGPWWRRLFQR